MKCTITDIGCTNMNTRKNLFYRKSNEVQPDNRDDDDEVDFTIDLTDDDYSDLQQEGGYVYEDDIIIAYLGNDEYIAFSKICTHQQCTVEFNGEEDIFQCPCHGSEFNTDGGVVTGPAEDSLKEYNTELNDQQLRVFG